VDEQLRTAGTSHALPTAPTCTAIRTAAQRGASAYQALMGVTSWQDGEATAS
jgi:hypothetical protein